MTADIQSKSLPADFDIEKVLAELSTLDQVRLIRGGNGFSSARLPGSHIMPVRMVDGPSGCRGTKVFNGTRANCFPCAAGLGASFDTAQMEEIATQLAEESRAKSCHVLLGPTLNIVRSPLAGRGFEMYSEDPLLAGKMGAAYIKALQSRGVSACMKHYVGNEQEFKKHTAETIISDRALREIYLEPFRIAVREADPWSAMASYSYLRGVHGSDSKFLIQDILRKEWGWQGTMISDWYGTHSTGLGIEAGCDLEMPGPSIWRSDAQVLSHIEAGLLNKKHITACARRMLSLVKRAIASGIPFEGPESAIDTKGSRALLRQAAANAVVLLKNENNVLPIVIGQSEGEDAARRGPELIGVFGFNAGQHFSSGGGAASVPLETFSNSPLSGIQRAAESGGAKVEYELGTVAYHFVPGAEPFFAPPSGEVGVGGVARIEFWKQEPFDGWKSTNTGTCGDQPAKDPDYSFLSPSTKCFMHDGVPDDIVQEGHYVRLSADFIPSQDGNWRIGLASIDHCNLFIDGNVVLEYTKGLEPGSMFFGFCYEERMVVIPDVVKGRRYRVELRCWDTPHLHSLPVKMPAGFHIGAMPELDQDVAIDRALALAKRADYCIVIVGLNKEFESEGYDREDMRLPGSSDKLVEAILAARSDAIIVTQSGMAVEMPWVSRAPTLLHAFYGGTSLGDGLADVLFGKVNPSAKLPFTFPKTLVDSTSYPHFAHLSPNQKQVIYAEDVYIGYRLVDKAPNRALFPFGHGLSYTTWSYSNITTERITDAVWLISFDVKNTGSLGGSESVQIYVRPKQSRLPRPEKELKSFVKVHLDTGAEERVQVALRRDAFAYWDDEYSVEGEQGEGQSWVAEAGEYDVVVGASSIDLRLSTTITLEETYRWLGL